MSGFTLRHKHVAQIEQIAVIGSWSLDFELESLDCFGEWYCISGMEPDKSVTFDRFMEFVHPDDWRYVREQWQEAIDGADLDIEYRILMDGEVG